MWFQFGDRKIKLILDHLFGCWMVMNFIIPATNEQYNSLFFFNFYFFFTFGFIELISYNDFTWILNGMFLFSHFSFWIQQTKKLLNAKWITETITKNCKKEKKTVDLGANNRETDGRSAIWISISRINKFLDRGITFSKNPFLRWIY